MQLTIISAIIGIGIALACAYACRRLALQKGRNAVAWTLLAFVLTVIALPVLVLLPDVRPGVDEAARTDVHV